MISLLSISEQAIMDQSSLMALPDPNEVVFDIFAMTIKPVIQRWPEEAIPEVHNPTEA